MTPGPVDDYVLRLERALRHRGCTDSRIVAEAREHLLDAVEHARTRGLSIDDAECEALDRFGAPEVVAAHAAFEGDAMKTRFAAVLDIISDRKWWILAPTVLTAVLTTLLSYYFLPTRYRSEVTLRMVSARVPADVVRTGFSVRLHEGVEEIKRLVLTRPRLEQIITEFGLYEDELETAPREDVVRQMREEDIRLDVLTPDQEEGTDVGGLSIAFMSSDPATAMKVTERLASLVVRENLQDNELRAESVTQFINAQISDLRRRITEYEKSLDILGAQNGGRALSQADLLPYEVLKETYRTLLVKAEESRMASNLVRRQIGEQFRIVEGARLPERPVGPSRLGINVLGTLVGLGLGLMFVVLGGSKRSV